MSTSNIKCLLCHEVVGFEDDKYFYNHMQDVHGAVFDLKLLLAVHLITPAEKVLMINKTDRMIMEYKSKTKKKSNIIDILQARNQNKQTNIDLSPGPDMVKSSVVDKIGIFERGGKRRSIVEANHKGLAHFQQSLKPVKTLDTLKQTDVKENCANDTINAFDEMIGDCTLNLDQTTDPFDCVLADNKILDESCCDATISDLTHQIDNTRKQKLTTNAEKLSSSLADIFKKVSTGNKKS